MHGCKIPEGRPAMSGVYGFPTTSDWSGEGFSIKQSSNESSCGELYDV